MIENQNPSTEPITEVAGSTLEVNPTTKQILEGSTINGNPTTNIVSEEIATTYDGIPTVNPTEEIATNGNSITEATIGGNTNLITTDSNGITGDNGSGGSGGNKQVPGEYLIHSIVFVL